MSGYRYRVTVEELRDTKGNPLESGRVLSFQAACHDDLLGIVGRVREKGIVADEHQAAAMAVGLKLFGEVVLLQRKEPLFAEVHAALGEFIQGLKQVPAAESPST